MKSTENLSLKYLSREPRTQPLDGEKPPGVILLHGFGSNDADLFGFESYLDERFFVASPRAPYSSDYGGYAWFELGYSSTGVTANLPQAEASRNLLIRFIAELIEKHDLNREKIYLCGFSQGAIMSFSVMLTEPEKIAGVVAMSGRMINDFLPAIAAPERLQDFPVLVTHGTLDNVLPIENGRASRDFLEKLPVKLDYQEYEIAHQVSEASLWKVLNWLTNELNKGVNFNAN